MVDVVFGRFEGLKVCEDAAEALEFDDSMLVF
jgi:hypothetical protein